MFEEANLLAIHRKHITVTNRDLGLVRCFMTRHKFFIFNEQVERGIDNNWTSIFDNESHLHSSRPHTITNWTWLSSSPALHYCIVDKMPTSAQLRRAFCRLSNSLLSASLRFYLARRNLCIDLSLRGAVLANELACSWLCARARSWCSILAFCAVTRNMHSCARAFAPAIFLILVFVPFRLLFMNLLRMLDLVLFTLFLTTFLRACT